MGNHRFSGDTDNYGLTKFSKLADLPDKFGIVLNALAETVSRIDGDSGSPLNDMRPSDVSFTG